MKKIASLLLLTVVLLNCFTPSAYAASETAAKNELGKSEIVKIHNELKKYKSNNATYEAAMSKEEVENLINETIVKDSKNQKITESDIKKAREKVEIYKKVYQKAQVNQIITISSTYDSNKAQLRAANFIEFIININEGLSSTDNYNIGYTMANSARDTAAQTYPNDVMLQDAYRHFTWNYISTNNSSIGVSKTYIATVNHEWGIQLLNPLLNYYDLKYSEYINQGYTSDAAANNALSATIAYISSAKYTFATMCRNSYSFFSGFMTNGNIMDFSNNFEGRYYALSYSGNTSKQAFDIALAVDDIITSESYVGDYQKRWLWDNKVYY